MDLHENLDRALYSLRAGQESSLEQLSKRHEILFPWYAKFLAPWLPDDRASPMIDVPCGTGNLLYALRKLGYTSVTGVDSEAGQVSLAQRLGLPATESDAFAAIRASGANSLSRVFSLDFIEHLDRSDAIEFSRLVFLALREGGFFICRTPSADGPFGSHDRYNDLTHRWAVTANAAYPLMKLAGFDPANVTVHQEAPVPYKLSNVVRRALFHATTAAMGAFLEVVGIGAPTVWTRSMWIVARKHVQMSKSG